MFAVCFSVPHIVVVQSFPTLFISFYANLDGSLVFLSDFAPSGLSFLLNLFFTFLSSANMCLYSLGKHPHINIALVLPHVNMHKQWLESCKHLRMPSCYSHFY